MLRRTAMRTSFLLLCSGLFAQEGNLSFERLSIEDGLSQSSVSAIMQDRDGFLWFGTQEGLNKYDGCSFTIYKYDPADSTSLPENSVSAILEDRSRALWVGTFGGGLCRLGRDDRGRKTFTHYRYNPLNENSLSHDYVNAIYEDRNGSLWVGTRRGLDMLALQDSTKPANGSDAEARHTFVHYRRDSSDAHSISNNVVTAICEDRAGRFWVGTRHGLNVLHRDRKQFTHYYHDPKNPHSLGANFITRIYEDHSGTLWIGTAGGGLNQYDETKNAFVSYRHDPKQPHSIGADEVVAIGEDFSPSGAGSKILWVGTSNAGLDAFDLEAKTFTHHRRDPGDASSISSDFVSSLYVDRSGLLWVGTHGAGLNKSDRKMKKFMHYAQEPGNPNSISNGFVWALCEDRSGALWVGTEDGLTRLDRKRNTYKHYYRDPSSKNTLSSSRIVALFEDPDSTSRVLWVGTPDGLDRFDTATHRFTHFRHDPTNPNSLSHNYVLTMHADHSGGLWLGTVQGLNKLDRATGEMSRYPRDAQTDLRTIWVKAILEADDRFLWVGYRYGLMLYDRRSDRFGIYGRDRGNRSSLSLDNINSLHQDAAGNLWIATAGGGLNKLSASEISKAKATLLEGAADRKPAKRLNRRSSGPRFAHFTENDGLCNNYIYGILADDRGCLWLSTNRGLACFDPATEKFKNYDVIDGLQSYEFNQGAFFKSPASRGGEMFFGGINGFNSFFPGAVQDNPYVPPVAITAFKKLDRVVRFDREIAEVERIGLSYAENFFSFEFVALDYTDPQRNQFAYKLEGFDKDWIYCGSRRYAIYTNVEPGNYVFRVKGSNSDGVWNERGAALQIEIVPPFWRTWWFSVVSAGSLIFGAFFFIQQKISQKIRHALELEAVRMQENERVRKQVADDFHDELGQKLTNMTLMAEVLKRNLRDLSPQNATYLEKIRETSKSLSNGVRNFIWALDPQQDSLYDLGIYLKDFGDEIFDKSGIHFRTRGISPHLESIKLPMQWRRHLALLFKEGMNNVLKHAACRNVTLEMSMRRESLVIALADDGRGFNGNGNGYHRHEKPALSGESGRGLDSMSIRATKLQGQIMVLSNPGSGTTVQFTGILPKQVIEHDSSLDR